MKSLLLVAMSVFAVSAFAQKNKSTNTGTYSSPSMSSLGDSEIIGTLGMVNSAINLGGQYNMLAAGELGLGGYFFLQTEKESNSVKRVYQTMSFGGQMKASLVRTADYEAYLSPGVGLHMIKDYPDGLSKSDVTALGPTLRIGVLKTLN